MNGLWNNLFGNVGQHTAPTQQNFYQSNSQAAIMAQQQAALYNQQLMNRIYSDVSTGWVINHRSYTLEEFATELFGEDTPERTMFLLRYAEIKQGEKG
jgi:hypothetical protein